MQNTSEIRQDTRTHASTQQRTCMPGSDWRHVACSYRTDKQDGKPEVASTREHVPPEREPGQSSLLCSAELAVLQTGAQACSACWCCAIGGEATRARTGQTRSGGMPSHVDAGDRSRQVQAPDTSRRRRVGRSGLSGRAAGASWQAKHV